MPRVLDLGFKHRTVRLCVTKATTVFRLIERPNSANCGCFELRLTGALNHELRFKSALNDVYD